MRSIQSGPSFLVILAVLSAGVLTISPARAGTLTPDLEQKLARLAPEERISVLVRLREQAPIEEMRAAEKARGASLRDRHREVIRALQAAAQSQRDLVARLASEKASGAVDSYRAFWITNLVSVTATRDVVLRLAARPDVASVAANFHVQLIEPVERGPGPIGVPKRSGGSGSGAPVGELSRLVPDGVRAIRAPEVWREFGITGQGVVVANLDTGVDGNHPALRDRWRGRRAGVSHRAAWFVPADTSSDFPVDDHGHGTHVMGTITGLGVNTADTVGVAWGAEWIAADIFGPGKSRGVLSDSTPPPPPPPPSGDDVIDAFQWFADPDRNPDTNDDVPDVVQNSWGVAADEGGTPCDPTWWDAIDNCEAAGVVVTWSGGNSGPRANTMIVPADRATTPRRNFSIGAVRATEATWPYTSASFSSRGPSYCTPDGQPAVKPEVVAPGVSVYSSVPGGGYEGGWSGTSMAGPHAAGVVALIRQAAPDLDPDTVKEILMQTARAPDPAHPENNEYGWGFIDAYAAVTAALTGYGKIEGTVLNGSVAGLAVADAEVTITGTPFKFRSDAGGSFHGALVVGDFQACATARGFAPETLVVHIAAGGATPLEFHLRDIEPPQVRLIVPSGSTADTLGPYPVRLRLLDPSGVTGAILRTRRDAGAWADAEMTEVPAGGSPAGEWHATLSGAPSNTTIEYYVIATDGAGLSGAWPPGAPDSAAVLQVRRGVYATSFEDPPEPGWQAGAPGDDAVSGVWVQVDPVGTYEKGEIIQPEDDHTPDEGVECFVTGNGEPGGSPGDADVDGGCTTLLSPVVDLRGVKEAYASYARWFNMGRISADDTLSVDVSSDGGSSWVALERVSVPDSAWHVVDLALQDLITLTDRVRLRFVACDRGVPGITEAAVDDVSIETFTPREPVPPDTLPPGTVFLEPSPNPARGSTTIRFAIGAARAVSLDVFDIRGRHVRSVLRDEPTAAGGVTSWDGRDDRGRKVPSGLYYLRMDAGGVRRFRPVVMLK